MFTYDVQLITGRYEQRPDAPMLRGSPVHRVIRFCQEDVRCLLIEHGCNEDRAIAISKGIPEGFPIVIDDTDGSPIQLVLLHLLAQHRRPKTGMTGERSLNSAVAGAYDLCHFLDHMDEMAYSFDQVIDQELVDGFAEAQSLAPSARTGRFLSRQTIARRVASVKSFCASNAFSRVGRSNFSTRAVPAYGAVRSDSIHPMTAQDWSLLKQQLGPKPSEATSGTQPVVMRLIVEWALWTAARRTEIVTLPISRIRRHSDLCDGMSDDARRIRVTNTKGRRPRDVIVPAALLRETFAYVRGERASALRRAGLVEADSLFVQPIGWRHPGLPISPPMASRRFAAAMARASLRRRSWDTAGQSRSSRQYVFHDLRHTAAVWLYIAFSNAGMPEPWKLVQARLGHLRIETTTRTYLAFIDEFEAGIADLLSAEYDKWALR